MDGQREPGQRLAEGVDHRIIWNALVTEFPADAVTIRAMLHE